MSVWERSLGIQLLLPHNIFGLPKRHWQILHQKLLKELIYYRVGGKFFLWNESWVKYKRQRVGCTGHFSGWRRISCEDSPGIAPETIFIQCLHGWPGEVTELWNLQVWGWYWLALDGQILFWWQGTSEGSHKTKWLGRKVSDELQHRYV